MRHGCCDAGVIGFGGLGLVGPQRTRSPFRGRTLYNPCRFSSGTGRHSDRNVGPPIHTPDRLIREEDGCETCGRDLSGAFHEVEFSEFLRDSAERMKNSVDDESEDYILNVPEDSYVEHLASRFSLAPPILDLAGMAVDQVTVEVPAELFPSRFNVYPGKRYSRPAYVVHIPFSGDPKLLRLTPSTRFMNAVDVWIEDSTLCFEVLIFSDDAKAIRSEIDHNLDLISKEAQTLQQEAEAYNLALPDRARTLLTTRKAKILANRKTLAEIGIPLRKRENVPGTFSVPVPIPRKSLMPKPRASQAPFTPHPTLSESDFRALLHVLADRGLQLERYPSTHRGKGEEELRDLFLADLEPRFGGAASAETFNRTGKTDILLRHENANLFVAECKIWSGPKNHGAAIDQLLGYLTWRESKAALLVFVPNQDFTAALTAMKDATESHACCRGDVGGEAPGRIRYRFCLHGDSGNAIQLEVMAFHLPEMKSSRFKKKF